MRCLLSWVVTGTVIASASLMAVPSARAQWGSFKGTFTASGKTGPLKPLVAKGDAAVRDSAVCAAENVPDESIVVDPTTNALANVVIYLQKKPDRIHPELVKSKDAEVVFDQKNCRFMPHILIVRTDQRVRMISDDAIAHNAHSFPIRNSPTNIILVPSDRQGVLLPAFTVEERLPVRVTCDIHNWMTAYLVIHDHPYVAVTNSKGEFEITNLPEGDHNFIVWHEKVGYIDKAFAVTIEDGMTKDFSIDVPFK